MRIKIDLPDMASRVTHGFHLTNQEARWLLKQIGIDVPLRKRCNVCDATGEERLIDDTKSCDFRCLGYRCILVKGHSGDHKTGVSACRCRHCHGEGYLPAEEPEYEVVPMVDEVMIAKSLEMNNLDPDEMERIGNAAATAPWWEHPREVAGRVVDSEIRGAAILWNGNRVGSTTVCRCVNGFVTFEADREFILFARNNWSAIVAAVREREELRNAAECWRRRSASLREEPVIDEEFAKQCVEAYRRGEYVNIDELLADVIRHRRARSRHHD